MKVKAIIGSIALGLSLNANAFIGDETGPCIYEALLHNTGPFMSCGPMAGEQWTHELEKEFQELVDEITAEMGDLVGSREGMEPEPLEDPYAEYWEEEEVVHVSNEPDFQLGIESAHITGNVYATSMTFTAIENSATLKAVKFNRGNCPTLRVTNPKARTAMEQVKTRFPVTADYGEKIYVGLGNCNLLEVEFTTGRGTWTYKVN